MDQIVAQALTVYGKIEGLKRKEAAAISAPTSRVIYTNGNGAVNGNGSGVSTLDTVS
jgi:hypothetical protein